MATDVDGGLDPEWSGGYTSGMGKQFDPDLIKPPTADDAPADEGPISVSQLNAMVKRALSRLPRTLAVAGEVSNFTQAASGHLYFSLKDEQAQVRCVMWKSAAGRLKFRPEDGLAVIAIGEVDVYEPRGEYQLYVRRLQPQGRGELELAFRQLHDRLEKLGWFAAERKRPIPWLPGAIGVVTSRTGAAIRDITRTLALRWPGVPVYLADARVQGEGAGEEIARGIDRLNRHADALGIEVLIVGRGGGSLEDLWAFNTEPVARAIFESKLPVVSAVGHEVDTTISDLVADARAATPTAAAQMVVPDRREVVANLNVAARAIHRSMLDVMDDLASRLQYCARFEAFRRPEQLFRRHRQQVDELVGRLVSRQRQALHARIRELNALAERMGRLHPRTQLTSRWRQLERLLGRLRWALGKSSVSAQRRLAEIQNRFDRRSAEVQIGEHRQHIGALARQIEAYNPRGVLERGYSITRTGDGRLVTGPGEVSAGERIVTELADGQIQSDVVDGGAGLPRPAVPPRRRRKGKGDDGSQLRLGFGEDE